MSKQRPDPDKVANELAGASAFFRRPASPAPAPADQASPVAAAADQAAAPPTPHIVTPQPDRPVRRLMIRHAFEVYADQLERLRELAEQQKRQGEVGSMSKMVRDAIDRLLDEQQS